MTEWYQLEADEALRQLETNPETGISTAEVARRQEKYGRNALIERGQKSPWAILAEQFTNIMVVILIFSAFVSMLLGETTDALIIMIIVVLNAILGFTQEYRAEQAMAALKKMAEPHVRVRRDGRVQDITAHELVPGDIILLEAGNSIPADARLVESANLRVQEAVLTGESEPVEKNIEALHVENPPIGDRRNMVFMGTVVTYGRGQALVVQTGMETQLGKIADMIQTVGTEKTPLQRRLEQLAKGLAVVSLGIVSVVFLLGVLRNEDPVEMFRIAVAMAVAAVPEGLPAVVTIALAMGAQRMLKRKALIRKLPAVETLGSVTVICSDKTGTLTENRMTVTIVDTAGNHINLQQKLREFSPTVQRDEAVETSLLEHPAVAMTLLIGTMSNDALLEEEEKKPGSFYSVGDPTEGALVVAAARAGMWKDELDRAFPREAEAPFDSDRKRMSTAHRVVQENLPESVNGIQQSQPQFLNSSGFLVMSKGAVDSLLDVCDRVWAEGKPLPMDETWKKRITQANNEMAANGMRVLGMAFRHADSINNKETIDSLEKNLIFVGMVGMIDPARPEVKGAVETTKTAGIRPIMITGDHPLTATFIAGELGIASRGSRTTTGSEIEKMSEEELRSSVEEVSVYARVSPEHKLRIVQALQDCGEIVAMTGDGVNDAPALKRADIGVAMGITGTDVAKEASDMVLLDDNYATIVAAVEEGRRIYDNIRKFIKYTMTSNAGEIWVMLLGPLVGMPLPLTPVQILWVNLVTDGLPGLGLTVEPAEPNIMKRPPYSPNENFFGRGMARDILWIGLLMGIVSLGVGYWFWLSDNPAWQTIIFTTLTMAQMGNALATRSENESLFKIGITSNPAVLGAVLLTFILQMAVVYIPLLQSAFGTVALSWQELIICLLFSTIVFWAIEIFKWVRRQRSKQVV